MRKADRQADELIEYAKAHPQGFTWVETYHDLGIERGHFYYVVRLARLKLAADDMTLVCEPQGLDPWEYRLVGRLDDARPWVRNRVRDTDARVRTMSAVMDSCVHASSGRTSEGRKARVLRRGFARIVEDLDEIEGKV